jgi:hypothetical protein
VSTKATIELSIQDKASGVLKNVGQEFLNTAKLARQLGNVTDAKALEAAARHVGSVSSNLKAAEKDARRTTSGLKEATSAMKSFGSALPGGGTAGNLLGLNGVVAFAATAGAIVANSIRLAAEYNRISQVSTYSLTSNASMLASNLAAFKAKAIGMADLGIGAGSGARMIAGYGMASGLDGSIASANGRVLGTWAKAYGQDPGTFGQQMGLVSQYAGSNVNGSASAIFGAASVSGDAGRRVSEFIGVATSVLQQVSASHAGGNVDVRDALREITGITRLGGYFQTSQGLATTIGGMNQFGNNVVGNPLMQRIARQAGWSLEDMILGNHDTKHVASMANTAYRIFGGDHAQIASFLKGSMGLGDDQARAVFEALIRTKGNILGNVPSADPSKRIDAFKGSTEGKIEQALANLENAQTKVGDGILTKVAPGIEKLTEGIDKLVDSSDGWFKGVLTLLGIIAAANIARTGIGMIRGGATMLRGIPALGNALRGMSVGGELAGGGLAELMAGLGIGAVPVIMAAQLGGTMNSQGVTNRIADLERAGVPHADAVAIAQASARRSITACSRPSTSRKARSAAASTASAAAATNTVGAIFRWTTDTTPGPTRSMRIEISAMPLRRRPSSSRTAVSRATTARARTAGSSPCATGSSLATTPRSRAASRSRARMRITRSTRRRRACTTMGTSHRRCRAASCTAAPSRRAAIATT